MADAFLICCVLFAFNYIFCITISEIAFRYLNGKFKWIERESRLLGALLKDFDDVSRSVYQIKQKASQLLNSDELIQAGVSAVQVLNEWEDVWIKKARKVVPKAKWCVRKLRKSRESRDSPKWFVFVLIDLVPMADVALWILLNSFLGKKDIEVDLGLGINRVKKKIGACDIYASLELSRSKVRSLQDRFMVGEIQHESVQSRQSVGSLRSADGLISSLSNLITGNPQLIHGMEEEQIKSIVMHLQLLNAFMKDLQPLKLESEMEKSWLKEANKAIKAAKDVIDSINTTANQRWWISDFSNWMARWKLKEDITCVGNWISGLLETKERYGFKFIRRDSSQSAHWSPQPQSFQFRLTQQQSLQFHATTDDMDLSSAVNNIRNWLIQLPKPSDKFVSQVSSVSKDLEQMHKLFKDTKVTEDYAINLRNACLEQMKKTAAEAEQYSRRQMEDPEQYSETNMEDSEQSKHCEIHQIMDAVNLLQRCLKLYSIEVRVESFSVVGLEEDVHELVSQLTSNTEHSSIISIVGMKGIGKTTLAKRVYNHTTIANHFRFRHWVSIPQEYSDENALLTSVGNQVLKTQEIQASADEDVHFEIGNEKDYWITKVQDFLELQEKPYLVVLDDVWSNETMYALKAALPKLTDGSRIVLTTCNKAIASNADQNSILHQLRLRTKEESWELFTQMVQYCPDKMEALAKEVVGRGGGLPVAIIRVGYLLSGTKVESEEFFRVLERITQGQNQKSWSENLAVNREHLHLHPILSKCFSYFQLFSRDFEIPARRIVSFWVAQGLIQLIGDNRTPEIVAYQYLTELIGRNMIQVVQRKPNGKVKTCCLPTCLHYLLLEANGNISSTRSWSSPTTSLDRQLAFHFDDNDARVRQTHGLNSNLPIIMQNESYHHSVLIFDTREGNKPRDEGEFLHKGIASGFFAQLQILDLECVFRPHLPTTIGKLKQLAYLGLRSTYLGTIPASIGNLVNLLTLDLKHTHVRTLPSSIWRLKKLRHLYLNPNCQIKFIPLPISISMRNLQTLSGVFVDKGNLVKDQLDKLINLRKLGLTFKLAPPEQKVLENWIVQLTNLQSLKLASINDKSVPQSLELECFLKLTKLSSLSLFGRLGNPSLISKLPQSLTHLTLLASGIENDPMPELGKLPNLKSLKLNSGSYHGTDMVCSKDAFPLLFVLKLWNLDTLKKMDVQDGAMQNLTELEIKTCRNLTITTGLKHLKNLHKYKVI